MGYITPETYQSICYHNNIEVPKILIETGTFKGGVPLKMLEDNKTLEPFDRVYTIELGIENCQIASRRYKLLENGNVEKEILHTDEQDNNFIKNNYNTYFNNKLTLINADSKAALQELLPTINEQCCFWLDAHAGATKYSRGEEDCPLLQELDIIATHNIKNHIIGIDDSNLLGTIQEDSLGNVICDYSNITLKLVKEKILKINPSYDIGIYSPYNMEMLIAFVK